MRWRLAGAVVGGAFLVALGVRSPVAAAEDTTQTTAPAAELQYSEKGWPGASSAMKPRFEAAASAGS